MPQTCPSLGNDPQSSGRSRELPFVFVAMLWLGILLGVSFLATPVKFLAPSLDLPTALDVGRVTFAFLSRTEWVLCALLAATALVSPQARALHLGGCALLAGSLVVQAAWLLPVLDARVGRIIAGETVLPTAHHLFYISAEALKLLVLLVLAVRALWTLAATQRPQPCA